MPWPPTQINCEPSQGCAPGYDGYSVIRNMGFEGKGGVEQNTGAEHTCAWVHVAGLGYGS